MVPTTCAICGEPTERKILFPERLGSTPLTGELFSSRRSPDGVHYRLVRCERCGLVRSDPVLEPAELIELYRDSRVEPHTEVCWAKKLQGELLKRFAPSRGALLEVGCWSGFFLEEALAQGFQEVIGVEPSREARHKAPERIRDCIVTDAFRPGVFSPDHFDVVAFFQVLDHLPKPQEALTESLRLLKPGGVLLAINHDFGAWPHRLLGERSPIVDIGHTYFYDKRTMRKLLEHCGFELIWLGNIANTYPLHYWLHLTPLPRRLKDGVGRIVRFLRLDEAPLKLWMGNLGVAARKPIH